MREKKTSALRTHNKKKQCAIVIWNAFANDSDTFSNNEEKKNNAQKRAVVCFKRSALFSTE